MTRLATSEPLTKHESDGLAILRKLNEDVAQAPRSLVEEPPEQVLKEYRCKVHNCSRPAVWRCSGGFRYCDHHMSQPHDWDPDHLFFLIAPDGKGPSLVVER